MRNTRSPEVDAFVKSERQWPRALRIAHARRCLTTDTANRKFWIAVLKAYGAR
jgi:hypothetical protein